MSTKTLFRSGILIIVFAFLTQKHVSAQSDSTRNKFYQEQFFLKKSKQHKKLAVASLVSGGIIAGIGGYIWFLAPIAGLSESGNVEGAERTGKAITIVGSGLMAASIPLFISSSRYKQKATMYVGSSRLVLPVNGTKDMICIGARICLN